jgi:hypothetical protein
MVLRHCLQHSDIVRDILLDSAAKTLSVRSILVIRRNRVLGQSWAYSPFRVDNFVDGMPWQYFYKDDYISVFQFIAPITIALLSGVLALIPEKDRRMRE